MALKGSIVIARIEYKVVEMVVGRAIRSGKHLAAGDSLAPVFTSSFLTCDYYFVFPLLSSHCKHKGDWAVV